MEPNEQILAQIAQYLDISPSDYKRAQERFNAVRNWLADGEYISGTSPDIYLQGSFRLGTVVRPYRGDEDGDFDIDQVCELSIPRTNRNPELLKRDIGDRLKDNADYQRMLDDEGKRCWTLEYASEDGRPGFHLDILPSLPSEKGNQFQIDITDKQNDTYLWSPSNPKGYYYWFKSKNPYSQEFMDNQGSKIFESNSDLYENLNEVPKQLFRSPLQRAIQIMKRHRDVYFSEKDYKPISIILTTITSHVYSSTNIIEIILDFAKYANDRHESLIKNGVLNADGILDYYDNTWSIPNPVDIGGDTENFADKWNEKIELPIAFFDWVRQLKRDVVGFNKSGVSEDLNLYVKKFSEGESYPLILKKEIEHGMEANTNKLLQLIHLGIENKVDWELVKELASSEFNNAKGGINENVAKVNFYQIAMHRGKNLSNEAINDVKKILSDNQNSAGFIMCCNLILGTVTHEMIRRCVSERPHDNVLEWPIVRLADDCLLFPTC